MEFLLFNFFLHSFLFSCFILTPLLPQGFALISQHEVRYAGFKVHSMSDFNFKFRFRPLLTKSHEIDFFFPVLNSFFMLRTCPKKWLLAL